MVKRKQKADKMASTGIFRIKGEDYPFGQKEQGSAAFSELFDGKAFDHGALQRLEARQAALAKKRAIGLKTYPPPQESLDLHGYTGPEAEDTARSFIEDAGGRGVSTLRIITGKGLHSPGGKAVLPDLIEQLLVLFKKEGLLVAFQWEKKVKSRSGALIVYL